MGLRWPQSCSLQMQLPDTQKAVVSHATLHPFWGGKTHRATSWWDMGRQLFPQPVSQVKVLAPRPHRARSAASSPLCGLESKRELLA